MSALSLYYLSIPTFTSGIKTLQAVLKKAEEHAASKSVAADSYVTSALHPDMKPLSFQIQVVSNTAKKAVWRLTGEDIESWADDESTMAQLQARLQRTLDLLATVKPEQVNGKENTLVELQLGAQGNTQLPPQDYLMGYALPNFYFHITTAYAILRKDGVPLGKTDFLAPIMGERMPKA